jgi:hypothetical protein
MDLGAETAPNAAPLKQKAINLRTKTTLATRKHQVRLSFSENAVAKENITARPCGL